MTTLAPGDRFRLWPAVWPLMRILVLSALPVPDLPSRLKVRRAARDLARACDPWPEMAASGTDAARLALHRLLYPQRAAHRAVRSRQDEAATRLARVMIETYITGMYCLYEPSVVAKLQNGQLKMLRPMLEFLREDGGVLSGVPGACSMSASGALTPAPRLTGRRSGSWRRRSTPRPARRSPSACTTALPPDIQPRHPRWRGVPAPPRPRRRQDHPQSPSRIWGRRAPARMADACLGGLTAFLADREGAAWQRTVRHAATYADRHHERAIPPVTAIGLSGLSRGLRLSQALQVAQATARVREFGQYVQSGHDADDPAARAAQIRSELQDLLAVPGLDVPRAPWTPSSTT